MKEAGKSTAVDRPPPRRGRGRPSPEASEKLFEHILVCAISQFLEVGYGACSMDLIAERAQVTKRTLYYWFPSKEHLFKAAVRRNVEKLKAEVAEPVTDNLEQFLFGIGERYMKFASGDGLEMLRLVFSESTRFPEVGDAIAEMTEINLLPVRKFIHKCFPKIDASFYAHAFLHLVGGEPILHDLSRPHKRMTKRQRQEWLKKAIHAYLQILPAPGSAA